jgi:membrane protease YdiL (CAAX protease family)
MPHGRAIGLEDGVLAVLLYAAPRVVGFGIRLVRRWRRRGPVQAPPLAKPVEVSVARFALNQTILAGLLLGYCDTGWTAESVGVSDAAAPSSAFLVGLFEYAIFIVLAPMLLSRFGSARARGEAVLRVNRRFWPRGRLRRTVMLFFLCVFNPVTEELTFRGILVHQFNVIGAPLVVALLVGALVDAANHAYQGKHLVLRQLAFYVASVLLLYSPIGLVGAVGFHFAADLWPMLDYGRTLRAYRSARRARRRAAARVKVRAKVRATS